MIKKVDHLLRWEISRLKDSLSKLEFDFAFRNFHNFTN